ncbi:3'(2'),5'-bisphosphate nucleotidase CysQ family protein [Vallitalea okinawensis]|uniref:3'(2'),5'-bisphosphate nucleotidase CysQ family protein n=1 Tax=Vallitalea okinawensis TaxID=2078660 RepID=UPI000CFC2B58|nr:3'(2'),5'-bisphosphate nucleotidase CysQ [Vallitalea okinawensis]
MNLNKQLEIAKHLAIKAGEQIMKIYSTDFDSSIEIKVDNSPLTIADKKSNEIIVTSLKDEFPEIAILSEESAGDINRLSNDWLWIIDPLDGTKEFIKKNGQFTVNIALAYMGKPVLGVIYVPVTKTLFYASKGQGAFKVENGEVTKISVTDKLDGLVWLGSKSHSSEQEENLIKSHKNMISETISAGSSLKGTMIAEGKADVYYRFGYTCEWDTCAMQAIVIEAGGIFRNMDHTEMTYNRKSNLNEKGFYVVNRRENIWV